MAVADHSDYHRSPGGLFGLAASITTPLSVISSIASLGMLAAMVTGATSLLGFPLATIGLGLLALGVVKTGLQVFVDPQRTGQINYANLATTFGVMAASIGLGVAGMAEQRWWLTAGLSFIGVLSYAFSKDKNWANSLGALNALAWGVFAGSHFSFPGVDQTAVATTPAAHTQTAAAVQVQETFAKLQNEYQNCGKILLAPADTAIHTPESIMTFAKQHGIELTVAPAHEGKWLGNGLAGITIAGQTSSGELVHVMAINTSAGIPDVVVRHTLGHEYDHACFNQQQNAGFNSSGELMVPAGITEWMREVHADLAAFIDMSPEDRQLILAYKDANMGEVYDTAALMRYAAEQIPADLTMKDPQVQSFVYRLAFEAAHGAPAAEAHQVQWAPFDNETAPGQFLTKFKLDPMDPGASQNNTFRVSSSTAPAP